MPLTGIEACPPCIECSHWPFPCRLFIIAKLLTENEIETNKTFNLSKGLGN